MNTTRLRQQKGFSLIDAAIAALVLGVGVLGLTALNGRLLRDTGEAKARAEAVEVAQDYLERVRRAAASSGCADLPGVTDTVQGVNATYSVSVNPDPEGLDATTEDVDMTVSVAWDGTNQMALASIVNCSTASTTDAGLAEGAASLLPPLKTPTGRGEVGGPDDVYVPFPTVNLTENADGTYTYVNTAENRIELLEKQGEGDDATGQVLLSFDQQCETDEFSTVSGNLYIQVKNGDPIVAESDLFLLGSDASYCGIGAFDEGILLLANGSTSTSSTDWADAEYVTVDYTCYFAPEWWGNVGVVRTGTVNTNDRVCVGNPEPTAEPPNPASTFSKEPQLSTTRGYRAYREIDDTGLYESVGIGYVDVGENADDCDYEPIDFTDHHFVLSSLTGGSSCETEQVVLEDLLPDLPSDLSLGDNPGRYFCMADDPDGVDCGPFYPGAISVPNTIVHGTITRVAADWWTSGQDWPEVPVLLGIDGSTSATDWPEPSVVVAIGGSTSATDSPDSETDWPDLVGACKTKSLVEDGTTYSYSCAIDWEGFTGDSWFGDIYFTYALGDPSWLDGVERNPTSTLCMTNTNLTVAPVGESVAYVINDRFAVDSGNSVYLANSISFTDIPRTVTDVELNFDVKMDWCEILGTPNVSWLGTENKTLSWPAVYYPGTYPVSYRILGCIIDNAAGDILTPCTPSSEWASGQTDLSYEVNGNGNLANDDTYCLQVTAMATDVDDSNPSPVKCVSRSGGDFHYQ